MSSPRANHMPKSELESREETKVDVEVTVDGKDDKNTSEDDALARAIARLFEERATQHGDSRRRRRRSRSPKEGRRRRRSRERPRRTNRHSKSPRRSRRSRRSRSLERKHSTSRRYHRRRSDSSDSGRYGGYIPRKRHPNAPTGSPFRLSNGCGLYKETGFDHQPGAGYRTQDVGRLQQGFSPLPCPTRQVYVGNLVPGMVSDMALRQLFNSALSATGYSNSDRPGMEPVVSVSKHSDGRYAFVELRSPEMATTALQLSGQVQLFGQSISVGRPSGYVDPNKAAAAHQAAAVALAAFNNGEASAQQTFGSIGTQQPTTVGQMMSGSMSATASCFLSIEGLIDLEMLSSSRAYTDIVRSLRNECVKYGPVVQLKIPRPADKGMAGVLFNTGCYGKAFVQFADPTTAVHAKEGLMSMATGDKDLSITYVSPEVFSAIL